VDAAARDIVSPELVLVDPVLAECGHTVPSPGCGLDECTEARRQRLPASPPGRERPSRPAWLRLVPVLALAAAVLGATFGLRAVGGDAPGREIVSATERVSLPKVPARRRSAPHEGTQVDGRREPGSGPAPIVRAGGGRDPGQPSAGVVREPRQRGDTRTTVQAPFASDPRRSTLVWPRVRDAAWYEVRLLRGTRLIYLATARLPRLLLPPTWRRDGVSVRVQPSDQVFVWPVRAGGRAARPVVDGALASDLAPGLRSSD